MRKHWIMLTISFICIVVFPLGSIIQTLIIERGNPHARDGVMDLTSWNFDRHGAASLNGTWDFYPGQLLTPVDFEADVSGRKPLSKPVPIHVPSRWNGTLGEAHGYGTYHLRVRIPPRAEKNDYGIRTQNIRMAHRLFIDGKEIGGKGLPGTTRNTDIQLNLPFTGFTSIEGDVADIIIQVSNYSYSSGGIVASILFGDEHSILKGQQQDWLKDLMTLFGFILPAAFFLMLFRLRRSEKELRYLGLFSLSGAMYALTHGEKLLGTLLPFLSNNEILRLQLLSAALAYYYLLRYMDALVPGAVHQWFVRLGVVLVIVQCMVGLTLSPVLFSLLELPMLLISLVVIGYTLRAMLHWLKKQPNDGHFVLMSMMSIFMVVVLHTVGAFTTVDTTFLALYELLLFVFAQMILTATRFAQSFREVEALSERLLAIDILKDEFMANTSHELRTPLHGIINIAQSMLEGAAGAVTPKQAKNLSMITSTGKRLSLLVNDILDFSKLKNGEIELKRSAVDLESVARTVVEVSGFTFEDKPIVLIQQWPPSLPLVEADEDRLRQILYNLLGNAYKYTKQGEIRLYARVDGALVTVSVADTGVGITPDKLEDIFQSYEQGNGTSERVNGGTGLGLSITRKLVELGGGTIWVESEPGEGSTFHFTLPIVQFPLLQASSRPVAARYVCTQETRAQDTTAAMDWDETDDILEAEHTILIVDDDPVNRQVLFNLLSTERYRVIVADSGAAALKLREEHPSIDLVITDWMMPRMSGLELCRKLRENSSLSELPILMLTARGLPEDIKMGFQAGANDFLSKPVDAGELRARVRTLIEMRTSVQEVIRTEMAFLQAQIKPHFLYNALNVIIATCSVNPDKATDLLIELSHYLRGSFDFQNRDQLVPLAKELELVESYVHLEQARFEERLVVHYDIDPDVRLYLPPLSIQPLVENAIRHGVMERAAGGTVNLGITRENEHIVIVVQDDGVGIPPERLAQVNSGRTEGPGGVGLQNINRRLLSLYGQGLEIQSHTGKGTLIRFHIPMENRDSSK
ncbi:histidine kinase [Paenibacillus taichungensis]|uniref:Circadian input-output histidine kinase CikA n=1 Tax=Paenibacillus taichungensis TaxID=484184 RepID=A0A329QVI6_9BACL|nr:ATP-binding protein [Paenibacillus taichungensis]RAW16026.1 histidine kinase [Paenibacillus taichungensis]